MTHKLKLDLSFGIEGLEQTQIEAAKEHSSKFRIELEKLGSLINNFFNEGNNYEIIGLLEAVEGSLVIKIEPKLK